MTIELKLSPRRGALLLGHDNSLEVLVSAIAPPRPANAPMRKPLNLALVLDRSGSMSRGPLDQAKRCAKAIIAQMRPSDFVSVVAYDSVVELRLPAQRVGDGTAAARAVDGIWPGSTTALHAGWAAGAEQAARNLGSEGVARVLLLSDGQANEGITSPGTITSHCAQMAAAGVSTSTYGLGNSFNEELMLAMAKSGGGNGYYGRTAEDLMGPFQREFDLLEALHGRYLLLDLDPAHGVEVTVLNNLRQADGAYCLPDVAYGAQAWALLRLKVPGALAERGAEAAAPLLKASLRYELLDSSSGTARAALALPALAAEAYGAVAIDDEVVERAREVDFAAQQAEAAIAARSKDWTQVRKIMRTSREIAGDSEWLQASMVPLERFAASESAADFAKEASYKVARMHERIVQAPRCSATPPADFSDESAQPNYLRRVAEEGKSGTPASESPKR